jgi:hypothetical protein
MKQPYDTSRVDSFKELAKGLDIQSFLGSFVALLTELHESNECTDKTNPKIYWSTPYYTFLYCIRFRVAAYAIRTTSDPEYQSKELLDEMVSSLDYGPYFTVANWLDWKQEYNLSNKYEPAKDLRHQQGWVFKAYYPVMAAAASLSDTYFGQAAKMVPCHKRLEYAEQAERITRQHYKDKIKDEDLEHGMRRARHYIDSICEIRFFVV